MPRHSRAEHSWLKGLKADGKLEQVLRRILADQRVTEHSRSSKGRSRKGKSEGSVQSWAPVGLCSLGGSSVNGLWGQIGGRRGPC